jgi:hypothetical protein
MKTHHKMGFLVVVTSAALFFTAASLLKAQVESGPKTPTAESRNHDSAFSLLLETYRQFQNNLIQTDYSNRLSAAASLADATTRKEATALVRRERDLRLRRLAAQVLIFSVTYDHSRPSADQDVAATSRTDRNGKAAARELQDFVVIAPAADGSQSADTLRTLPSSAVLRSRP